MILLQKKARSGIFTGNFYHQKNSPLELAKHSHTLFVAETFEPFWRCHKQTVCGSLKNERNVVKSKVSWQVLIKFYQSKTAVGSISLILGLKSDSGFAILFFDLTLCLFYLEDFGFLTKHVPKIEKIAFCDDMTKALQRQVAKISKLSNQQLHILSPTQKPQHTKGNTYWPQNESQLLETRIRNFFEFFLRCPPKWPSFPKDKYYNHKFLFLHENKSIDEQYRHYGCSETKKKHLLSNPTFFSELLLFLSNGK